MAFGSISAQVARIPAGIGHDISIDQLTKEIDSFYVNVKGKDLEPDCGDEKIEDTKAEVSELNDEELDDQSIDDLLANMDSFEDEYNLVNSEDSSFYKYLDQIKTNACGQKYFSYDEQKTTEESTKCESKRKLGYIDNVIKSVMEKEAQEEEPSPFRLDDPDVRKFHKKAEFLLQEVRKYMADRDIEADERKKILIDYIAKVMMPMRDLIVIMRSYIPNEYNGVFFYESLLPEFPTRLFPVDDLDSRDLITMGPNPSADPFYLKIEDMKWGRSRLRFRDTEAMGRDIVTLLKAPTAKNYVRSLKWMTLQMLLQQTFIYSSMLGDNKPIQLPNSCKNHFNGSLPSELKFSYDKQQGQEFLDNILSNHGLTYSAGNYQFMDFYMNSEGKNPLEDGYSGMMPFEQYKSAQKGMEEDQRIIPDIDDYTYFNQILDMKAGEAIQEFQGETFGWLGMADTKTYTYQGKEVLEKILQTPGEYDVYEVELTDGEVVELQPNRQNLSKYLAEVMQRNGIDYFEDLISENLEKKLSRKMRIPYPSLYGSQVWTSWALGLLSNWAKDKVEAGALDQNTKYRVNNLCMYNASDLCVKGRAEESLHNISNYLSEFRNNNGLIPNKRLEALNYKKHFHLFKALWNTASMSNEIEEANPTEHKFIVEQMKASNPWARLRLGYLVAMEELDAFSKGQQVNYKGNSRARRRSSQRACFYRHVGSLKKNLKNAAKVLKIDRIVYPHHGNKLLSDDEKKSVWFQHLDESSPLFKVKDTTSTSYYEYLENISYSTLIDQDSVDRVLAKIPNNVIRDEVSTEIDEALNSVEGKLSSFFLKLYKMKGQPEEQLKYFEDFSSEHGIDNEFKAKMNFLAVDNSLKRPIYKSILKSSAEKRKEELLLKLNEFCNLEPNDHESMKTLFYSTTKAQNKINQLAGAPSIPTEQMDKIMDKINEMSPEEWTDMWLGIGAGVLGMAAILIGGACTGVTGGLCAPLGVAMIAAGASAMTMQVTLVSREFNRKIQADKNEDFVQSMEGHGFATHGSSDAVSRYWVWTIIEGVSIIPLIGVVSRSVVTGTKIATVSTKTLLRNTGRVGFKQSWRLAGQAGKTAASEADVNLAKFVLGFNSLAGQSKQFITTIGKTNKALAAKLSKMLTDGLDPHIFVKAMERVKKIRHLFTSGKISANSMAKRMGQLLQRLKNLAKAGKGTAVPYVSKTVVEVTPKVIDSKTAKVVSRYFGHNPKSMKRFMGSYIRKLDKAKRVVTNIEDGKTYIGKIPVLGKVVNWYRKLRLEQLAKYGDKIRELDNGLAQLAKNGGDLEKFVLDNMDDLTDIFIKIPSRKREWPYMLLLQGGPHIGGPNFGKRVGAISWMSDGLIMRKFFNARSRLIYESMKAQSRSVLGLEKYIAQETTLQAMRAFQESVADAVEKLPETQARQLVSRYHRMESKMAEKIVSIAQSKIDSNGVIDRIRKALLKSGHRAHMKITSLDEASVRKILFSPESLDEKAIGEVLWSSMPVEDLFNLREVGDVAHRVIRELSQYENVDGFERLLNALKVMVIKRDPGVVEIM
tara:strand:- start:55560 stop:60197 length:4638 start_codon:yes stop_codon:yes gene_type:complete